MYLNFNCSDFDKKALIKQIYTFLYLNTYLQLAYKCRYKFAASLVSIANQKFDFSFQLRGTVLESTKFLV